MIAVRNTDEEKVQAVVPRQVSLRLRWMLAQNFQRPAIESRPLDHIMSTLLLLRHFISCVLCDSPRSSNAIHYSCVYAASLFL